ncbi:hypothetical protein V5799_024667 [Amblyomma americanum]|uniref:Uncharacterized protein n=1 Tax=Amblyomma americanum TaxID=6943 RepID=A0AAQ4EBE1_AMBAM
MRKRFRIDDLLLLQEVVAQNPFQSPGNWTAVLKNVVFALGRELTLRAIIDRTELLVGYFGQEDRANLRKSGTEEQYTERDQLLQEISDMARDVGYMLRTVPRKASSTLAAKRKLPTGENSQALQNRLAGCKNVFIDDEPEENSQFTDGIRGLQYLGMELLTRREDSEFKIKMKELENEKNLSKRTCVSN